LAIKTIYHFLLLTGGSATALDSIDGNSLLDNDRAFTLVGGILYVHELDATSGAAESSPAVIAPDTNPGTKRWLLQATGYMDSGLGFADLTPSPGFSLTGGTTPAVLIVPLNATLPGQDTGTAAPVAGTWTLGWIRWNTTPTLGENMGWVCTTAGTPGVWASFGFISANPE